MKLRYDSTDLLSDLEALVKQNVKHFQSDFEIDKKVFLESLHEKDRDFIWFTRESGTGISKEKEAYMEGTYGNAECVCFLKDKSAEAYFVHIDGIFDNKLIGSYYPVDAKDLLGEIVKNTVPVHEVKVIPKDNESFLVPYKTYTDNASRYGITYGEFKKEYLLHGDDAKIVASVLLKHQMERKQARRVKNMNESKIFQYDTSYGEREDVTFEMNMYQDNNNLYLGLNYFDKDENAWDSYGNLTVNIVTLPYLHSTLDTNNNNAQCLLKFLTENGLGELTGQMIPSGFCQFPVFKFSEEKLKEICPNEFFEYQKTHGRAPSLNEQIKEAKIKTDTSTVEKGNEKSRDRLER